MASQLTTSNCLLSRCVLCVFFQQFFFSLQSIKVSQSLPFNSFKTTKLYFFLKWSSIILITFNGTFVRHMWPDLAKFRHFGKILSLWAIFWMSYLVFGILLYYLWHFYATGQIFVVVNDQILNSYKAIWSHWAGMLKVHKMLFLLKLCR